MGWVGDQEFTLLVQWLIVLKIEIQGRLEWQRFPLFSFEYFLIVAQGCGQRARAMKTSEEIDPTVCELRFTVLVKISRFYNENQDHIFHLILEEFLTLD